MRTLDGMINEIVELLNHAEKTKTLSAATKYFSEVQLSYIKGNIDAYNIILKILKSALPVPRGD